MLTVQASEKYMTLARTVLDGEKALFASWAESVTTAAPILLREPVLCRSAASDGQQSVILVNYPPALWEARFSGLQQERPLIGGALSFWYLTQGRHRTHDLSPSQAVFLRSTAIRPFTQHDKARMLPQSEHVLRTAVPDCWLSFMAWLCAAQIASEAKRLDRLGLQVPQVALNAALQQPRHRLAVEGLAAMLDAYRRARASASALSALLTP